MRILYVTEFFPEDDSKVFTGGIETMVYNLVARLSRRHQITVLYRPQRHISKLSGMENVVFIPCGSVANESAASIRSLGGRFRYTMDVMSHRSEHGYDLILGTNYTSYLPAFWLAFWYRAPAGIIVADVFIGKWRELFGNVIGILGENFERISLALPWKVFFPISQSTGDKLKNYGIPSEKIVVQHLGVDLNEFANKGQQKEVNLVVAVCRLVSYKRVQDLIEATNLMHSRGVSVRCEIVGKGPYLVHLKQLVEKYRLGKIVKFEDSMSRMELIRKIGRAKIFTLPSVVEGFGLVTIEAMAAGTPFVNSDIEITREITEGGKGGLLFEAMDVEDYADKLSNLLLDKHIYEVKRKEGLELVKKYDWDRTTNMVEKKYREVSAQK